MSYATIQEINTSIMFSGLSNEQLNSVLSAVKYARGQLGQQVKRTLSRGDTVKFTSAKHGCLVTGTVEKVAIKFVTIRATSGATGLWKVPANMLEST